ncbi:MAG: tRNA epoxyqueuosine(34) reductase QueG [Myxococcales bacterium]|nr:tRNA epoxyqueuosine(34) reductase QueG [Myxococcales bacterium]HIK86186.1 tRNA epoxyqueuosine(34) reductase QueG [Myxococcales bacterium]
MTMHEDANELAERVRRVGLALGLDAVGFADALPSARTRFLRDWVAQGYAGEMDYIERRLEERIDPRLVLPGAKTLIVVGLLSPPPHVAEDATDAGATGRIARYAGGDDYHEVLLDRVRALESSLASLAGVEVSSRSYVDTGPVAERAAAERAGLGWIAKNSCLIHLDLGSHLMLGVILTDLELPMDETVTDHCGTCRACLDVCPTNAFVEPYVLDATRCISYTTIESRESIPEDLRAAQGDHVFGCDLCQSVCPWNQSRPRSPLTDPLGLRARLAKREEWVAPTLTWILSLNVDSFAASTRRNAIKRSGYRGLIRNALVAAGNALDPALRGAIEGYASGDDSLLQEHANWALARMDEAGIG